MAFFTVFAATLVVAATGCNKRVTTPAVPTPPLAVAAPKIDPEILNKIGFDISTIDENGLRGPANGKTSVAYEFCILSRQTAWLEVQKIDPSLKFNSGPGRIACAKDYWCILGTTSGKDWEARLIGIAKLASIKKIEETVWE